MVGLTDAQLAKMRATAAALLPQTAAIQAETITQSNGRPVSSWSTVETVAARLDPLSSRDQVQLLAGAESTLIRYRLSVPYNAGIAPGRRVIIETKTYEIVQLDLDHAERVLRRAIVADIR